MLHNAIDVDKFRYDEKTRKEVRKEWNIKDSTLVIGHIGRFCEQKNHSFLIDIFEEIQKQEQDSILLLVGQGPKREEIQEKVIKLKLQEKVIFLGQRKDINNLYQAFDVFAFPSLYEGLGMVLIEAQCSNLYCITSTEVPKITKINENVNYFELSKPAKEWADQIIRCSKNLKERAEFNKEIQTLGYDIKREEKILTKKYLEILERIK